MLTNRLSVSMFLAFLGLPVWGDGLYVKDPALRDEDISAAQLRAMVRELPTGMYEYVYDIVSPPSNKGRIVTLRIDARCELDFGGFSYPDPPDPYEGDDSSIGGQHVPIRAYRVVSSAGAVLAGAPGISTSNAVYWGLNLKPGGEVRGIRMLSPAPPGSRTYQLEVGINATDLGADGTGWNYESCESVGCPDVPWVQDFRVTGMTTAPACSLTPPPEPARFPGSMNESDRVNQLLTYSMPLVDHLFLPPRTVSVPMTVFYSADIDPKTFKVTPAHYRRLFSPAASTSETVAVPLSTNPRRSPRQVVRFEVRSVHDKAPRKDDELDHSNKDTDVFTFARDDAPRNPR